MKQLATAWIILCLTQIASTQCTPVTENSLNLDLIYYWDGVNRYNDIWGYTNTAGDEYIILGSENSIHFFQIDDTTSISEDVRITPGSTTIWRDFKTYQDHAYGVADQGTEGLIVMDLSTLPSSVSYTQITTDFLRAHNIFIDGSRLYVAGSNTENYGMIVYDISTPSSPVLLASVPLNNDPAGPSGTRGYVHDVYVRNNIAYCSHGRGGYYVWDFTTPTAPVLLGGIEDPATPYNHSSWVTDDGNYAYWAEELPRGRPIHIADVSNLSNINVVHEFSDPLLCPTHLDVTPHNPFISGNLLYISYYEDGLQIYDISNPVSPLRVAYYDTDTTNTAYNGTRNNWGTYPYFSENKIAASDVTNGLFLLAFDEAQALAVEISEWSATRHGDEVLLHWATAQEINNQYFSIQRSRDTEHWEEINQIDGRGTSLEYQEYSSIDRTPYYGINYYRLRAVDLDGTSELSEIVSVDYRSDGDWSLYPNPAQDHIFMNIPDVLRSSSLTIAAYHTTGRQVIDYQLAPDHQSDRIELGSLAPGIYTLVVKSDSRILHRERLSIR